MSLVDKELAHIKGCKGSTEAWWTLCNIHKTKCLSNILFIRRKFCTIKMNEGDDILDHINKVKSLTDQLTCLNVPMKEEDVVMILHDSLLSLFDHLITTLETCPMKELTWFSSPHNPCTRCPRGRIRSLKKMMRLCCHANLEHSTTTNNALIPQGVTIEVS